ncbi:protein rapunzel-like [Protopterus annectens]|uniref:protein rapunzel-like n=1 Tax=Protopterus annectens TaxID=7888 RepID=UPI001CFB6A69|nr:protein rapunzel-like [Protopterus annectens]XP_043910537.1 protein rapunzel-like [Protopterus annectens]XP_043910538.1 protein rapunzel-like [Protopterus annectens]XP_043910539.1 protein rapunzel-like [Protopterus annectens]
MSDSGSVKDKIRKGVKIALKCIAALCSAMSAITPLFGPAGSILNAVANVIPGDEESKLGKEFDKVHAELKTLSDKTSDIINAVKKQTSMFILSETEDNLKQLFKACSEIEKADPADVEKKKANFIKQYEGRQERDLYDLYELVTGQTLIFANPILEVYKIHTKGKKGDMQNLCDHIRYLFSIGMNCYICYLTITDEEDDFIESEIEEWQERMETADKFMVDAVNAVS